MAATRRKSFRARLKEEGQDLLIELIQLAGFLFVLKAGEVLVRWLFHEALVFGIFPKEWLFDAGDVGLTGMPAASARAVASGWVIPRCSQRPGGFGLPA